MEYALDEFRVNPSDLWHTEMLMVFAVGELLSGTLQEDMRFPGERFFMEAMNNLSNLSHVHAAGTQGIELMALIAFYLQCADRKDDAYIYVSIIVQ
jgi:proline utilization trans-activator